MSTKPGTGDLKVGSAAASSGTSPFETKWTGKEGAGAKAMRRARELGEGRRQQITRDTREADRTRTRNPDTDVRRATSTTRTRGPATAPGAAKPGSGKAPAVHTQRSGFATAEPKPQQQLASMVHGKTTATPSGSATQSAVTPKPSTAPLTYQHTPGTHADLAAHHATIATAHGALPSSVAADKTPPALPVQGAGAEHTTAKPDVRTFSRAPETASRRAPLTDPPLQPIEDATASAPDEDPAHASDQLAHETHEAQRPQDGSPPTTSTVLAGATAAVQGHTTSPRAEEKTGIRRAQPPSKLGKVEAAAGSSVSGRQAAGIDDQAENAGIFDEDDTATADTARPPRWSITQGNDTATLDATYAAYHRFKRLVEQSLPTLATAVADEGLRYLALRERLIADTNDPYARKLCEQILRGSRSGSPYGRGTNFG